MSWTWLSTSSSVFHPHKLFP